MIITLSGVTGAGKSYYKNLLVNAKQIENMVIYTTREKRATEIDKIDKNFVNTKEFNQLVKNKEVFANYELLGEKYGYSKKYLNEKNISVTELHYEWVPDFKEKVNNIYSIYIVPKNIEIAKQELKKRNLPLSVEQKRLAEMEEQIIKIENDKKLQENFDIVFNNDYTKDSDIKMLQLIENLQCSILF